MAISISRTTKGGNLDESDSEANGSTWRKAGGHDS